MIIIIALWCLRCFVVPGKTEFTKPTSETFVETNSQNLYREVETEKEEEGSNFRGWGKVRRADCDSVRELQEGNIPHYNYQHHHPHKHQDHRVREQHQILPIQQCGCCGGDRNLSCCLPPPSASGLETLTVVEWRMQLLLKNKPPPCGGGGHTVALDIDSTYPTATKIPDSQTQATETNPTSCQDLHESIQKLNTSSSGEKLFQGAQYGFFCPKSSELNQDPVECVHHSPYHHIGHLNQLSSTPVQHYPLSHGSPGHFYQKKYFPIHPHGLLMHQSSPDMSTRPCTSVSRSARSISGSQTHVLDQPAAVALGGSPSSGPSALPHPSPITGAAAYHPDIVAGCCPDPHQHRYNYHHHHHHHHHHAPISPAIEVYSRAGSGGSVRKPPKLDPTAETIDPRFTQTCPCGGRLLRATSIEKLCKTGALSSDEIERSSASHWKGAKSKGQKEEGARRKKEGKGKMRRFAELTHITALFRPRKVR